MPHRWLQEHMGGMPAPPETETSPPPSVFQKLKPSQNRYTLLANKDEL